MGSADTGSKDIRFRLRTKLLVGILLLEAVLMAATILVVENQMRESILQEFEKRGISVTQSLAAVSSDFVTTYNYVKIEQTLDRFVRENNLLYATIVFFDGDVAGFKGTPLHQSEIHSKVLVDGADLGSAPVVDFHKTEEDEHHLDIAIPILVKGESWGTVRAGFPMDSMRTAILETREALLALGLAGLLLGWLASVFLARKITFPINRLVDSVQAISDGEYHHPINIATHDEIGYLGYRFEVMQETLREQFQMLAETNDRLSQSNETLKREVSERRKAEGELRGSEARLCNAQRIAKLGFWEWQPKNGSLHWSPEVARIFGISDLAQDATFPSFLEFVHLDDRPAVERAIKHSADQRQSSSIEHRIVRPDGSERIVQQEMEASIDECGDISKIVGTLQDITDRKRAEERVRYLAFYDSVTGLPNRALLTDRLTHWLRQAKRYGRAAAVLFLDLDHFKRINDTLGHSAGDDLLRQVAGRLASCVRKTDCVARRAGPELERSDDWDGKNTVARLGGDEFVIVLTEIRCAEDAAVVARRVNDVLSEPFVLDGGQMFVSTSIGVSAYPTDGEDAETLLKHADAAMYHAKSQGRNHYQFYTASMNAYVVERLALENSLRDSIERRNFVLYYQPKADIRTGNLVGMEALVRWVHPEKGFISPAKFIPIAEETGLIVPLGEWILQEACKQARAWQLAGLPPLRVSVNLSTAQFKERSLPQTVGQALEKADLHPDFLELELTESLIMENLDASTALLAELKAIGVLLSIDDFGTGYSSLSYLKRFPIDVLKIDQTFIRDLVRDSDDAAIVAATIALGHSLRLTVVAEGVEEQTQLDFLRTKNCDQIQGYLLSPPLPAEAFGDFVRNRTSHPRLVQEVSAA